MPQTEQQRQATFQAAGVQPAATAPVTPAPQPQTPAAPQVNVNVGTQPSQQQQSQQQAQPALTMPSSGSVVDLLNAAGQDSSFANRQQLAQQYGMQGYQGTAAQNAELSKKYLEAYNAQKALPVPQTGAEARSAMQTYFDDTTQQETEDPQQTFMDSYMNMNPVVKTLYDQINQQLSTPVTTTTFAEEYKNLLAEQGVPALQTELMNINNIMEGTEDDIRMEITKAGGFATESQVKALASARNKTLLKQANTLQQQLALKEDYVDQIMQFSQLDRKQVEDDVDRKLGLTEKLAKLQESMTSAASDNFQEIVDTVGYKGLAEAANGDEQALRFAEQALNLPSGALSNQAFLDMSSTPKGSMSGSIQEYEYAKSEGYTGSFIDYQNEDANRKRSIAAAGVGGMGLTPAQINQTVNQIAGAFDNEPAVKEFNTANAALNTIKQIGPNTKSPTDDMAFIYAFAKIMDPNSVVREGEYKTVQDYAQALTQKYGLNLKRIYDNSNFLTSDAKSKMISTLEAKVGSLQKTYEVVSKEYQRQIDDAYNGKPRQITNYSTASDTGPSESRVTVTSPNGDVGTIPSSQLSEALKGGYKIQPSMTLGSFPGLTPIKK